MCMRARVCVHTCMHACLHAYVRACMYPCMCVPVCACVHVFVWITEMPHNLPISCNAFIIHRHKSELVEISLSGIDTFGRGDCKRCNFIQCWHTKLERHDLSNIPVARIDLHKTNILIAAFWYLCQRLLKLKYRRIFLQHTNSQHDV